VMGAVAFGAVAIILLVVALWRSQRTKSAPVAAYVGEERCLPCHAEQVRAWRTSHHAQAMQAATDSTVLGDFNDGHFADSTFFKKDGKFLVRASSGGSEPQDYTVLYTFGVYPVQQYLLPFPEGRIQTFGVAWDSRGKDQGGQRWFHLNSGEKASFDPQSWARRDATWNYACADCHSTNVQKSYDLAKDSYATKWSRIHVSCEACHGPGSNHIAWAQAQKKGARNTGYDGLVVDLRPAKGSWSSLEPWEVKTKHWQGQVRSQNEINTCAPCHSRRQRIVSNYQPGQPFLDAFVPSLLEEGIYSADGQPLDEDYEWGSFVQSKMYRDGVTCSDCHEPHSGKMLETNSNALCGECHEPGSFAGENHHHHKTGSAGAQCVNCHMVPRTSMVVDVKHDHAFRVPRPDLSVTYGTPNACNQCHRDKSSGWAADMVVKWYGSGRRQEPQFVGAIDAGRRGLPNAERVLTLLIADTTKPGIARATALQLLRNYLTPFSLPVIQGSLGDDNAVVRREAVKALAALSPRDRARLAAPLLTDSIRSVRIEAARLLAGSADLLQPVQKPALEQAIAELIASTMVSAERPESHIEISLLYAQMGRVGDAEAELKTALRIDPDFVPAMLKLAELCRSERRDDESQQWLERAIAAAPNAAEPIHTLGLLKLNQKQYAEGISFLARAAALEPNNVRYSYVYAVALNASGHVDEAIATLQQAHQRRPADRQVLVGLIAFERDTANLPAAISYAQQLVNLAPNDVSANAALSELRVANDPKTYQYWVVVGDAQRNRGRLGDATGAYRKGLDMALADLAGNPRHGSPHVYVAYFAARLGDKATAEQEIQQAMEWSPGDDKVLRRAVLTYEALGERDRAIDVLNGAAPQLLNDLDRQPDLADFRQDARFQQLIAKNQKAGGK